MRQPDLPADLDDQLAAAVSAAIAMFETQRHSDAAAGVATPRAWARAGRLEATGGRTISSRFDLQNDRESGLPSD